MPETMVDYEKARDIFSDWCMSKAGAHEDPKGLCMRGSLISFLPQELGHFENIVKIDLCRCRLSRFPSVILQMTTLKVLNLVLNKIDEIPEGTSALTSLETLEVSNNLLFRLPRSIGELTSLTALDIRVNEIQSLPETIGQLVRLTSLNMSFNGIRVDGIPVSMEKLTSLKELEYREDNFFREEHRKALLKLEELLPNTEIKTQAIEL